MSKVRKVSFEDFDNEVLKSSRPILVDFWAEWCGPCKLIAPILDELSIERDDVIIMKANVDENENQKLAEKYGIRGIPTMLLFVEGEVAATKVGATSKAALSAWLDSNL